MLQQRLPSTTLLAIYCAAAIVIAPTVASSTQIAIRWIGEDRVTPNFLKECESFYETCEEIGRYIDRNTVVNMNEEIRKLYSDLQQKCLRQYTIACMKVLSMRHGMV